MRYLKGQVNFVNLLGLAGTIILFMALLYFLQPQIDATVAFMLADANPTTSTFVVLMQLTPFFILLAIIITGIYYSIPRGQGG